MLPKVSIIIPTYNSGAFIVETVQSALEQQYIIPEVIIVNDGSTDETEKILCKAGLLEKIIYQYQKNQGPSEARNRGLKLATGEYCAFLDSDDLLDKNFCIRLIECMSEKNARIAYCNYTYFNYDKKILKRNWIKPKGNVFSTIICGNIFPINSILFTRELAQGKYFDTNLKTMEDWLFWVDLMINESTAYCNDILCFIRVRQNSLSTNTIQMRLDEAKVFELISKKYKKVINDLPYISRSNFSYYFSISLLRTNQWMYAFKIFFNTRLFGGYAINILKFLIKCIQIRLVQLKESD